jgi:hypothetical protein
MRVPFVMGAIHEREVPMRTRFNRQARRAALCNETCRRGEGRKRVISLERVWLAAYGRDLARLAERIDLELPAEIAEPLSPVCSKR